MAAPGAGRRGLLRAHHPQDTSDPIDENNMATPARSHSSSQRQPPPSLFLHPSPAASHVSIPGIMSTGSSVPGRNSLTRERSNLDPGASVLATSSNIQRAQRGLKAESTRNTDRTDALWAEMQATLEEVELSASGGTHVFGPEHDRKLGDLRAAQIALAQAWARSEADDAIETAYRDGTASVLGEEMRNMKGAMGDGPRSAPGEATDGGKSTVPSQSAKPESSAAEVERLGAKLEEETETDILLARRRREANDEYFRRVNNGVIDVVAKLDDVAKAMKAVEQESKDVWNENETLAGSSRA